MIRLILTIELIFNPYLIIEPIRNDGPVRGPWDEGILPVRMSAKFEFVSAIFELECAVSKSTSPQVNDLW